MAVRRWPLTLDMAAPPPIFPPMVTSTSSTTPLARFWLPLQATWLMMAVEGPFLAAVIARQDEPVVNLAAYGVAFALAIIVEAPVIMMLSAATALVDGRPGYLALRRFARVLNAGITAVMLLLLVTPAMAWLLTGLLDLDPRVAGLTRAALWLLLPWPAAIGHRRFHQGVLIRAGMTRRVAWGTAVRLASMAATAVAAVIAGLDGASVGALAMTGGVCAEAVAVRLMARRAIAGLADRSAPGSDHSWRGIAAFYWPLALTSTISLAVQPVVTFFMGHARAPLESLAVLPVVNALVFLFRTPGLAFQETAIAQLGDGRDRLRALLRFAALLAMMASGGLALLAWTPLAGVWLERVSGLEPALAAYAVPALRVLAVMPALSVLLNLERALLVHGRRTPPITTASTLEILGIAVVLAIGTGPLDMVGVTAAAVAFLVGRIAANGYLLGAVRDVLAGVSATRRRAGV